MLSSEGGTVTEQSPIVDQLGRLSTLLLDYGREEVWLHVLQIHPLSSQHAQVVVAVEDDRGEVLRERSGRSRPHTFRLERSLATVEAGHRFRVARDESGVRVEHETVLS